jgi:hypothetical protein
MVTDVMTALILTAPWALALAWVLFRHGLGLGDSVSPSMSESAQRRLSVL